MRDFSDNSLDTLIERSLRSGSALRVGQKQRAWDSLRGRIAADSMMVAIDPEPARPGHRALLLSALRWLVWLCVEESHYERAARRRLDSYPMALFGEPLGVGLSTGTIHREPV